MAKDFQILYQKLLETFQQRLEIPDCTTEKLSYWTYSDMKKEFQKSMELFSDNGFGDECIAMAYKCSTLSLMYGLMHGNRERAYSMTENAMAITIYANEALRLRNAKDIEWLKRQYEEHISAYRNAPTHGLILSAKEQLELDRDIESVLEHLAGETPQVDTIRRETLDCEESDIDFGTIDYSLLRADVPSEESDKKLRERLSGHAYEMLTEFEREKKITDINVLEQLLAPHGLKMTDKLREFIELYDGRVYAWRDTVFMNMDRPFSCNNFEGFSIFLELDAPIFVSGDKYYINAMDFHVSGDWGPYIGSDGKIYNYCRNMELMANSPEEFFEEEAKLYFKDSLLIERRRELENKYLIPEIRTASM